MSRPRGALGQQIEFVDAEPFPAAVDPHAQALDRPGLVRSLNDVGVHQLERSDLGRQREAESGVAASFRRIGLGLADVHPQSVQRQSIDPEAALPQQLGRLPFHRRPAQGDFAAAAGPAYALQHEGAGEAAEADSMASPSTRFCSMRSVHCRPVSVLRVNAIAPGSSSRITSRAMRKGFRRRLTDRVPG